jgi:anti-sigma B factor antagonist
MFIELVGSAPVGVVNAVQGGPLVTVVVVGLALVAIAFLARGSRAWAGALGRADGPERQAPSPHVMKLAPAPAAKSPPVTFSSSIPEPTPIEFAAPRPPPSSLPEDPFRAPRERMDELSYAPGSPNVLSMTKYHATSPAAPDDAGLLRVDDGQDAVVHLRGSLDALTAPRVRPALAALAADGRRTITLDLSALRMVDSAGVEVLVQLASRCRAGGVAVRVSGLRRQPLSIFRLFRLDQLLPAE